MGTADIIPGVSGGTIALISGIYDHFIIALSSPKISHLKDLLHFAWLVVRGLPALLHGPRRAAYTSRPDWAGVVERLSQIHWSFLIPLVLGILLGLVTMSQVIPFLMTTYPFYTYSFFFGLIAFSLTIPFGLMDKKPLEISLLIVFTLGTFILVGNSQLFDGSLNPVFLFFSGALAICAMVLPGISGAFILVILGQYKLVLTSFQNLVKLRDILSNFQTMFFFTLGVLVGIFSFVRLLRFLLKHYHSITMAALTGFMVGSLRKIWPFSYHEAGYEISTVTVVGGIIALVGALLVFALERFSVAIGDPEPPIHPVETEIEP